MSSGDLDIDGHAVGEAITGWRGSDHVLFAATDGRARGSQAPDDASQRNRPGGGQLIAPDDRRQPVGRQLLAGQGQRDQRHSGPPPAQRGTAHGVGPVDQPGFPEHVDLHGLTLEDHPAGQHPPALPRRYRRRLQ
jgi:hypothetical protein